MVILMERVMGIEPTRPAWKAGILPLNYTRIINEYYYTIFSEICQALFEKFFKRPPRTFRVSEAREHSHIPIIRIEYAKG